ncbi:hypothetical protein QFZ62_002683 [Clavibacter sp. B3I6]|uniref:hypothetical protein n=1 Tax=Clavibacter sp. B3I6 TaxID=3042268 RepID=UPI002784932F|nr:hypothetical protein [Clavibacter sp. B3I6]MDQ0745375.1 hypothetical protein [Clavibacter sp. B3I6]
MFLRDRARGRDTWSLVVLGVVLCAVSVLGLMGVFGELDGAGRFGTVVLIGVPLGLVAIGGGIANGIRGLRDTSAGAGSGDEGAPAPAGDRADLSGPDGTDLEPTRPDGMIDR